MSHAIHKIVSIKRCQSYFISRRSPHLGISKDSESCASAHRCLHYAYARLIARVTFHLHKNPRPNNQPGDCTILIILCQRELEISLSVVVGDIGYDLGQSIVICREFTTLYPVCLLYTSDAADE